MRLHVRVRLETDAGQPFMGLGLYHLLKAIERHHSLAAAARDVGLSYVKAWRILTRLERVLQTPLVIRSKGGMQRGRAELTPYGKKWTQAFGRLVREIEKTAQRKFRAFCEQVGHRNARKTNTS